MAIPVYLFVLILSLIHTAELRARIIHVPGDATTIQGAINGATDGDTVLVAPGTCNEFGVDFQGELRGL